MGELLPRRTLLPLPDARPVNRSVSHFDGPSPPPESFALSTRSSSVQGLQEFLAGSLASGGLLAGTLLLGPDQLLTTQSLGVRVEPEQDGLVLERVLLLGEGPW